MMRWARALAIAAVLLAAGCRPPAPSQGAPAPTSDRGRWQVVAFTPAEGSDIDGAILVDTQSGETYILCEDASAWCKLDRQK